MASTTRNGVPPDPKPDAGPPPPVGPHPGVVSVPAQYVFEQNIRQMQKAAGSDPGREDAYRVQGVQMIDNVRRALKLCVSEFPPLLLPPFSSHPVPGADADHPQPRADL